MKLGKSLLIGTYLILANLMPVYANSQDDNEKSIKNLLPQSIEIEVINSRGEKTLEKLLLDRERIETGFSVRYVSENRYCIKRDGGIVSMSRVKKRDRYKICDDEGFYCVLFLKDSSQDEIRIANCTNGFSRNENITSQIRGKRVEEDIRKILFRE